MQSAETIGSAASHDGGTSSVRVVLLLERDLARDLENWRRRQDVIPTRTEGIRRLLSRALVNDHVAA